MHETVGELDMRRPIVTERTRKSGLHRRVVELSGCMMKSSRALALHGSNPEHIASS